MKSPDKIVKAHQYLYYVKNQPIWTDYQYDRYCSKFDIEGVGGSDSEDDYTKEIKDLANDMKTNSEYSFDECYNK